MSSLPPTSPRLPSPPPPAEIQIGPKSPSMGPNASLQAQQMEQTAIDANARRRIHPGTKAAKMAAGPPLVPLNELDSAFQLQEHLAALHYHHTECNTRPMTRDTAKLLATPPAGTDRTLWLYELCRFLTAQCNTLIVGFLFDTPPCSAATCPEMRASEWQFLCAVHDAPKSCCAIDYCCHTLDWAANVVTNAKIFPSRFVVDAHDKNTALKNLVNVFRRLHRIFAHAWFQHRGVFWSVEGQTGLYVFFKTVCDLYDLLSAENYKLPPEAEGLEAVPSGGGDTPEKRPQAQPTAIAKREGNGRGTEGDDFNPVGRTNTRRHIKSSPSTGSAVATVLEADEDEGTGVARKLRDMHITAPETVEEEPETADVPVIVEDSMMDQPPLRPSSVIPRSPEPESMRRQNPRKEVETVAPGPVSTSTGAESSSDLVPKPEVSASQPAKEDTESESPEAATNTIPNPIPGESSDQAVEATESPQAEDAVGDETILSLSAEQNGATEMRTEPHEAPETSVDAMLDPASSGEPLKAQNLAPEVENSAAESQPVLEVAKMGTETSEANDPSKGSEHPAEPDEDGHA